MKAKHLLIAIFLMLSATMSAQTYFWEAFDDGQMPPTGWTLEGLTAQWAVSNSANAGGSAPEGVFNYIQQNTTTRLISPVADLSGLTTVKFSFRFFYDWYSNPAPKFGVATRSNSGTWTSVYEKTPTGNMGPQQVDIDITNTDVGSPTFQICIYLTGNMYNLDYFYVDNMLLFNPLNKDAAMISLGGTPTHFSDPVEVKGSIMNTGLTVINSLDIDWQLDNGPVYSSSFTGLSLATQQTYDFTCSDILNAVIGAHVLKVWIRNVNGSPDDYHGNDTLSKAMYKICHAVPRKPLFEEFTSSTCSPCKTFNLGFVPWCNTNEDNITLVKYQMNWPGSGDPYYTEEGGVRREYYGVGYVPDLYCNGSQVPTDMAAVQNAYDQEILKLGMMKIAATHTLNGHIITVDASVLPFSDFPNCMVQIVVMEKVTHNNATTNGETSFEHVMMKMIPDANGSAFSFTDRVPVNITETVDLTGTHVEEWDDLIVAVFVQHISTKEVYQSAYSIENGTLANEARLASIMQDGQPIPGFLPDVFDYEVRVPSGTVIVPEITATPIDTNETVIVIPAVELPGTTSIDVFAQDLMTHNQYNVEFIIGGVGFGDQQVSNVNVYPNPTSGLIRIMNANHSKITVFATDGTTLMHISDFAGSSINLGSLPGGVYMLSVEKPDQTVIKKKIVLVK